MAANDFIVAIELGSSKIAGIAGKKLPDGSIQVLATAYENASDCIRKGVIYNLDKTTLCLTTIIKKLETALKSSLGKVYIGKAYIGIGGQSLRTIRNTEVRHLEEKIKISQELIDELKDSNRAVPIVGYEILGVAPQEYKVGNDFLIDPVGVQTDHIEARFLNIIARNTLKQNIVQCCEDARIEIADDMDDLIAPLALANVILSPTEKRSGCVLVDFGADTTTVSIYNNNILRHLAVIPLGGNNITKDICSQQIEEEDAELLKKQFGEAYIDLNVEEDETKVYTLENKCSIKASLLEDIVEARVNEILENVANQITLSGYDSKLLAGAILTGGGANLNKLEEAFKACTKIDKVRIAKETSVVLKGIELKKDCCNNTLIALLKAGKENCSLETPEPTNPDTTTKRQSTIERQLFTDDLTRSAADVEDEEEAKREKQKEEIIQAKKQAQEEEELKKRKRSDCEGLIQEAVKLKNEKNYKAALKKLEKAKEMDLPEKKEAITHLEEEVRTQQKDNSVFNKWLKKIGTILDED